MKFFAPSRFRDAKWEDIPVEIRNLLENIISKKRKVKGLFISGQSGRGKTHICYALMNHLIEIGETVEAVVLNVPQLLEIIREDYNRPAGEKEFNTSDLRGKLVILDDLGSQKTTEWAEEKLYLLINEYYEEEVPMIITSNYSIEKLPNHLSDRIVSRIAGGCEVVELEGKDKRTE